MLLLYLDDYNNITLYYTTVSESISPPVIGRQRAEIDGRSIREIFGTAGYEQIRSYIETVLSLQLRLCASLVCARPTFIIAQVTLAAVWSQLGDQEEVEWKVAEILTLDPDFSIETWVANEPLVDRGYIATLYKSLKSAGLPE